MSEQSRVREVLSATSIVGHDIDFPRDVVVEGNVAVVTLMQGPESQEVSSGGACGG